MRKDMMWLFFFGLLILQSSGVQAATVTSYISKEGKAIIILNGEIALGDADQLALIIKTQNAAGRLVSGIRLNSNGGNLVEGVKLAELIRTAKIASVVPNGSQCASACFIAFAAGYEKYASYQASVGVHGASDQNGRESTNSNAATVAMAKIVKELGVPSAIIGRMVVTPPDQIVWLSPDELKSMGATLTGKPSQLGAGANNPPPMSSNQPMQLPSAPSQSSQGAQLDWHQIVDNAWSLSASQNGGTANSGRTCQPELKTCTTAVFFRSPQGAKMMVRISEDVNGNILKRDICEFNAFGDIRTCLDWKTKVSHKDMKDANGAWIGVED